MKNDLRLCTDQHWFRIFLRGAFHRFRGQIADQYPLPFIAVLGVLVVTVDPAGQRLDGFEAVFSVLMPLRAFQPADDLPVFVHAAFVVLMAGAFLQTTDKNGGLGIAGIRMDMLLAGQRSLLQGIAGIGMGMYFFNCLLRLDITAAGMLVCFNLGKRTPQVSVFIVAGGIVTVNHKIGVSTGQIPVRVIAAGGVLMNRQRLRAAHGSRLFHGCDLGIAGLGVGMLRDVALLLHGDGREDQRIGGTEYHHCRQAGHHLIPAFFSQMCFCIFLCALQRILRHVSVTVLPDSASRSPTGARPGIRFFRRFVHRRRSPP